MFTPRPLGPFVDIAGQVTGEFSDLVTCGAKPHQALRSFLEEISAGDPTIVFLEDVHWADEASLDLVGLVGRRIGQLPALVVASYRDDEIDPAHPLQTVLGRLATVPSVTRLKLEPLSRAAVCVMAAPYGVNGRHLYQRTGGNPFFVTEVLSCGVNQVPPTVRDAVLARAANTSSRSRDLLEAVAIMPVAAELALLETLADGGLDHLDECLALGILVEERGRVRFRHELARLVIEDAIRPARRVALHRATLRALKNSPGWITDPARLAHHAEQAHDEAAVLDYAPVAGDRAATVGAHREAVAQYARALRSAGSLPLRARARLHERLSYENYLSDQPDQALDARRQALAIYRALRDRRGEGESLCWLARLLFFASRDDDAEEAAQAAINILTSLPPGRELAMAYSTVAHMRMLAGNMAETIRWGERAVTLAERCGEEEVLIHALNNVGAAEFSQGLDRGREKLERSLDLSRAAALTEHVVRAYVNLASVAVDLRRYAIADRYLAEGLAYAAEEGIDAWRWYLLALRARSWLETGRWTEATDAAQAVLAAARPRSFARLTALVVTARVRARRAERGCWPLLDEALQIAALNGHLQQAGLVAAARAEAHWLEGGKAADC